ncbi:hypothetical protein FXO38_24912 [Capsicum annuum]|nr:hypothetical protein FXO38_24912 [Capsicum annuum]
MLRARERTEHAWKRVLVSMGHKIHDGCAKVLALSYNDLPSASRPCFLYFGLYPEDHVSHPVFLAEGGIRLDKLFSGLRLGRKGYGISMLDLKILTCDFHQVAVEVGTIVSDDGFGNSESTNDVASNKVIHDLLCNLFVRGCFYPLGEVVNYNKDKAVTIGRGRLNGTNNIHALSCEGPRRVSDMEFIGKNSNHISMSLTLVAFLHIEDAIVFYGQPEVA